MGSINRVLNTLVALLGDIKSFLERIGKIQCFEDRYKRAMGVLLFWSFISYTAQHTQQL